jgi:hypothetical protein
LNKIALISNKLPVSGFPARLNLLLNVRLTFLLTYIILTAKNDAAMRNNVLLVNPVYPGPQIVFPKKTRETVYPDLTAAADCLNKPSLNT